MSSTYIRAEAIGRVGRGGAGRRWVGGVAAALVVGGGLTAAVAWPQAPTATRPVEIPAAPPAIVAIAQPAGGVVEGPWRYEWVAPAAAAAPTNSTVKEYIVEGPFGYEVVRVGPRVGAPTSPVFSVPGVGRWVDGAQGYAFEPVTAADGFYDEGPQGYEWRSRAGR